MSVFLKETEANFTAFDKAWRKLMDDVAIELAKDRDVYLNSYRRIISLQAWRNHLAGKISNDSLAFFLEAQNDALTSHVSGCLGSWRSALKALRSCIENVLFCLYYKDHPVEHRLWSKGHHKLTFSEHFKYVEDHPDRLTTPASLDAMPTLRSEYSTLSEAVHASSKGFRMTEDIATTLLWSDALDRRGRWATRETVVLANINLLLLAIFREQLIRTNEPGLRSAISLAIPVTKFADIKTHMKVTLTKP